MSLRLIGLAVLAFGFSPIPGLGQSGIPHLDCKISVNSVLRTSAQVAMDCSTSGTSASSITLAAIRFPNQEFRSLRLVKPDIELEPQSQPHLIRVALPAEIREWQISYRIEGSSRRIPLFVPEGSWDSKVAVEVAISGLHLGEESFPMLREQVDFLRGEFSHLPGFLFLPLLGSDESAKWLSIQDWIDLSVLLLILIASVYWMYLRRQIKEELAEMPASEAEDF